MKRRRRRLLGVAAAVLAAAAGAGAYTVISAASGPAAALETYTVYSLGAEFEGLPLVARLRRLEKPTPGDPFLADFYNYVYGRCTIAKGDDSCPVPLEIQSWAACRRNRSVYKVTPDGPPLPRVDITVRGVPAALFEDGGRLEVYTGRTTVVIFAKDTEQARRAAEAMRAVKGKPGPSEPLPKPAAGALEGKLKCK